MIFNDLGRFVKIWFVAIYVFSRVNLPTEICKEEFDNKVPILVFFSSYPADMSKEKKCAQSRLDEMFTFSQGNLVPTFSENASIYSDFVGEINFLCP